MCPNCFEKEVFKFNSEAIFEKYRDSVLASKRFSVIGPMSPESDVIRRSILGFKIHYQMHSYVLARCVKCNEEWKLSEPDMAYRGFMIKKGTTEYSIQKYEDFRQAIGAVLILLGTIILFGVIAWILE